MRLLGPYKAGRLGAGGLNRKRRKVKGLELRVVFEEADKSLPKY